MPYITKKTREQVDEATGHLVAAIILSAREQEAADVIGTVNYVITRLVNQVLNRLISAGKLKYRNLALVAGMLDNVKQEFYRRVVNPYEDGKIRENGDVPEFM